jgi:Domain of unknown function DUF1828
MFSCVHDAIVLIPRDKSMNVLDELKEGFCKQIAFREKRPGMLQIIAPIFHEDGDMIDLFIQVPKEADSPIRIVDGGLTLMKLSYDFDVDTENKRRLLSKIIAENGVKEDRGQLFIEARPEGILAAFLQMAQTVAKITNLQYLKRQMIQSLFYESFNQFVGSTLLRYAPIPEFRPLADRPDLEVDWKLQVGSKEVYLYGVKEGSKARLAAISCLEFQLHKLPFRSMVVHEDFESGLSKRDQSIITNAADKQFTSLDDFRANAEKFLDREAA